MNLLTEASLLALSKSIYYSLYLPPGDMKTEGPLGLFSMQLPVFS